MAIFSHCKFIPVFLGSRVKTLVLVQCGLCGLVPGQIYIALGQINIVLGQIYDVMSHKYEYEYEYYYEYEYEY